MHYERPSRKFHKVALNILTLGEKPEMIEVLPSGIVDPTEKQFIASGATGAKTVRWYSSQQMHFVYESNQIWSYI
jgi:hypothetical protein